MDGWWRRSRGWSSGATSRGAVEHAAELEAAFKLRIDADYTNKDLTEAARELRDRVGPFLAFCLELVAREADRA